MERYKQLRARWEGLHDELLVVAAAQPSREVSDLLLKLSTEASNATIAAGWVLSDVASGQRSPDTRQAAKKGHASAEQLLEEAIEALRVESGDP